MFNIPQDILLYILLTVSAIALILLAWNIRLELKVRCLSRSKGGFSIEDAIGDIEKDLKKLGIFKSDIEKYLSVVEKRLSRSVQGVSNVSFNAFKGMDSGGTQSFATALLNEKGDGVIISTLHARDRVNVFSKEVADFKPLLDLSSEEKQALTKASQSCKL